MLTDNIIPLPRRHKGDPELRRFALATIGFRWRGGLWRRGRVVLTKADIAAMAATVWEQALRRWTTRRPQDRPHPRLALLGRVASKLTGRGRS
jgi:hypothetical protein